jgi:hypothetical protein
MGMRACLLARFPCMGAGASGAMRTVKLYETNEQLCIYAEADTYLNCLVALMIQKN